MPNIQIKRYTGSAWEAVNPRTVAQNILEQTGTTAIFDGNDKLKIGHLPDAVFDTLTYYGTTTGDVASAGSRLILANALEDARLAAAAASRNLVGYYFVITATGTITGLTGIQSYPAGAGVYYTLQFRPQDGGTSGTANTSSGVLEAGDWFVIESISGAGTSGTPYVITASVVNNSFELATTAIDGIVRLSDATVYSTLSGNHAITEGVLKTVIDNAGFALSGHTHLLATGATDVTATASELNLLDGELITTTELNYLSGVTSAIQTQLNGKAATSHTHLVANITDLTATATELNYVDGVTSAIQTQLNAKAPTAGPTFTGTVVLPSTTSIGTVDSTEIGYLDGVTSAIQTQLNAKQATITGAATTIVSSNLTASRALASDGSGKVAVSSVTATELGYLSGVTSAVQTQLNTLSSRVRVYYDGTPSGMVTDDIWFDAV